MAEECPDCGATFASPAELVAHVNSAHQGGDEDASMAMNPEARHPGLVCALCGQRFDDRQALAEHNLRPHYRANRRRAPAPAYA
jgi:uncharacterized C2H2 Zn-finger protein